MTKTTAPIKGAVYLNNCKTTKCQAVSIVFRAYSTLIYYAFTIVLGTKVNKNSYKYSNKYRI